MNRDLRRQIFLPLVILKRVGMMGFICAVVLPGLEPTIAGTEDIDRRTRVLFLDASYGLATLKSEALVSNDTGSVMQIHTGAHVGSTLRMSVGADYQISNGTFELVSGSIAKKDTDVFVNYRMGYMESGLLIGSSEFTYTLDGTDTAVVTASGFGGLLRFVVPTGKSSLTYLNAKFVTYNEVTDTESETTAAGPRISVDIGSNILLSREVFHMVFGYRYESYSVTLADTSYAELITNTYIGFGMGFDF